MPSDPDNVARALAAASFAISALSLYLSRREIARKGTRTTTELRVDATGHWRAFVRNPTDLDVRVKLTLAGAKSTSRLLVAWCFGWLHPLGPGTEWRTLSQVVGSYGGKISEVGGPQNADDWVIVPAKQYVEWRFSLDAWWPKYMAIVVENGLGGLSRGRFRKYRPGRSSP